MHRLVLHERARFGELKPKGMDGNMFTYHLQQLIAQKYVVKNDDGTYELTPTGKAAGINIQLSGKAMLEQAHAILLLAVRDETGAWLLRKRLAQPNYGLVGFIHGEPVATEPAIESARAVLQRRTGLTADFTVAGSGYIRIFKAGSLESFTAFTLLKAEIERKQMKTADETGENFWAPEPDFNAPAMLPSMPDLVRHLTASETPFFLEETYSL